MKCCCRRNTLTVCSNFVKLVTFFIATPSSVFTKVRTRELNCSVCVCARARARAFVSEREGVCFNSVIYCTHLDVVK